MEHEAAEITKLLQYWREGDLKSLDALLPLVYKELRRLVHVQLRKTTKAFGRLRGRVGGRLGNGGAAGEEEARRGQHR